MIDTSEQKPFEFPGIETQRGNLFTGDYSLLGYEDRVTVERKGYEDAWQCSAKESQRFEECVQRMAAMDRALIVIEPSLKKYSKKPKHVERVTPATAVGRYVSWMAKYRVPVVWCENRSYAARITARFLAAYLSHCVRL